MTLVKLTFLVFVLACWGCQRSLQIGAPSHDGGIEATTDGAQPPQHAWYAREEAYVGEEVRVPVPESMTLGRDRAEAQDTPISIVTDADGMLLVAQGNRLVAFDWGPNGPRRQTPPAGVRVATAGNVVLVPGQRIALVDQRASWGNAFSGPPDWSSTTDIGSSFGATALTDFSVATAAAGDSLAVASVQGGFNTTRLAYFSVWQSRASDGATFDQDPDVDDDLPFLDFHGGAHHVLVDRNRFLLARLRRRYPENIEMLIQERGGVQPWRIMAREFPQRIRPNWFQAAFGGGHVLTAYGRLPEYSSYQGAARYRIARVDETPEWGMDIEIDEVNSGNVGAVAWDESHTAFVLALGIQEPQPASVVRTPVSRTALFRIARDGRRVRLPDIALSNVSLSNWRDQVWGAGVDVSGELQIFSANAASAPPESAGLVGPQQLQGMLLHHDVPTLLWSDGTHQAALSRIDLTRDVAIESRALDADSPTLPPRFLRDGDDVFVASGAAYGGVLAQLDADGNIARRQAFPGSYGSMWPLLVHGDTVVWRLLYYFPGPFSSGIGVFDRNTGVLRAWHGISNAAVQCVGPRCVADDPPNEFPAIVFDAGDNFAIRSWAPADATTFRRCVGTTSFPTTTDVRDGRAMFERDLVTGNCLARVMPYADPTVPYVCAASSLAGETCGDIVATSHTATHTVLAETRVALNAANRLEIRLYTNDDTRLVRTLTLPIASDDQRGLGRALMRDSTRLLHVRGGLFLLAYSRTGATGVAESYIRVVFFPEVESAAQ